MGNNTKDSTWWNSKRVDRAMTHTWISPSDNRQTRGKEEIQTSPVDEFTLTKD
jgi:hypothetical protein